MTACAGDKAGRRYALAVVVIIVIMVAAGIVFGGLRASEPAVYRVGMEAPNGETLVLNCTLQSPTTTRQYR